MSTTISEHARRAAKQVLLSVAAYLRDRTTKELCEEYLYSDIQTACEDFAQERVREISDALQDAINLFNDADKIGPGKQVCCTEERREAWQAALNETAPQAKGDNKGGA